MKKTCFRCNSHCVKNETPNKPTIVFCPNYCDDRAIYFECLHQNLNTVRVGEAVRYQCNDCGELVGNFAKKANFDFHSLPAQDKIKQQKIDAWKDGIRERYSDKVAEKREEVRHTKRQIHTQEYHDYLQSAEWAKKRELVLKRDNHLCQSCLTEKATQVHHLSYQHIFNEPAFHLISVCKSCHDKIHS